MSSGALRLALKKLAHRDWSELKDEWLSYIPVVEFGEEYPEPTIWQIADLPGTIEPMADQAVIRSIDGVREATFREVAILVRKFSHCRSLIQIAAAEGRSTWAAVAAYEACFYGAKAFCYLLGIVSLGRTSQFYLDIFVEVQLKSKGRIVEERYDMKLHKLPERLTHAVLWGLFERLINTTNFNGELADHQIALRPIGWDDFSHFRNSLMYDGAFWTKLDRYSECDLIKLISDVSVYRAARGGGDFNTLPFASEYFHCSERLGQVLFLMFSELADLAPAIVPEAVAIGEYRL